MCEVLRAGGIKCAFVPMPSEKARRSPTRFLTAAFNADMVLTVIVAPGDELRARELLAEWDRGGAAPDRSAQGG